MDSPTGSGVASRRRSWSGLRQAMLRSHLLAFPVALSVAAGPSIAMAADPRATPACKRGLSIASAELTGLMMRVALGVFLR
jgi:hypothetical protein